MSQALTRKFFTTAGHGSSEVSPLNAFDAALVAAGIGQCNLVPVTSIIPKGGVQVRRTDLAPGLVTFVVLSHIEGGTGETISAAVAWGMTSTGYGLVCEAADRAGRAQVEGQARDRVREMARVRGVSLKSVKVTSESFNTSGTRFGSVVAVLVLLPEESQPKLDS